MNILNYEFTGEGMQRVFENEKWTVGIKNWKPANDVTGIDCLERHNKTDELFVLVEGSCTLVYANETEGGLEFGAVKMEKDKVYNIPATLWHNTITCKDTKMILIEDSNTSMENSDILNLTEAQIAEMRTLPASHMRRKKMKFFVDTANVEEIKKANDMGIICGVTTNPSLIAKEGRDFAEVIKEITDIVDGPISGEGKATTVDAEGMIAEGREIAKIHPNMVVKIPMTVEGLKAVKVLNAEGVKTNVTLVFSAAQALLAARAFARRDVFLLESEHIAAKPIPVEVHVRAIHQRIQNKKTLRFSELVDERTPVPVVVVTFLAVLELYKRAMVKIEQAELFGDIDIRYIEGSGELVLTGDDSLTSVEEG